MPGVALPQASHVRRHVAAGHFADVGPAGLGQSPLVTRQVPAVGLERVGGEPSLDQQVIEIAADRLGRAGQPSTSSAAVQASPWASATGP